jgi:hypothetical protein
MELPVLDVKNQSPIMQLFAESRRSPVDLMFERPGCVNCLAIAEEDMPKQNATVGGNRE